MHNHRCEFSICSIVWVCHRGNLGVGCVTVSTTGPSRESWMTDTCAEMEKGSKGPSHDGDYSDIRKIPTSSRNLRVSRSRLGLGVTNDSAWDGYHEFRYLMTQLALIDSSIKRTGLETRLSHRLLYQTSRPRRLRLSHRLDDEKDSQLVSWK